MVISGRRLAAAAVVMALLSSVGAGRILGIFYLPLPSHFAAFKPLLKELAARGHEVIVASNFPQEPPLPNYTDINLNKSVPAVVNTYTMDDLMNMHFFKIMHFHWVETIEMCRLAMEHPSMKALAQSREHFDVVLVEVFGTDCAYGYAHKLGAPVIGLTSLIGLAYGQERVGNADNPAYSPVANLPFTAHMDLWERVLNTAGKVFAVLGEKVLGGWPTERMMREYFGEDMPPLDQMLRNTSLVMVNSHFSINGGRPAVPAYVEVGGMHVDPKRGKLPKEMQQFLDGAGPAGAVVVSFGSLLPAETMPKDKLRAFLQVLGALPQRVVWRVDGARVAGGLPLNVLGAPWIPQQQLLSHPKVRAFVGHGGLGGMQEAVQWGVPAVVVPFFTDQRQNAKLWQQKGAARILQYHDITAGNLKEALNAVLNEPRYMENAKKLSVEFRDRPQPPLETAVFWTEYVMRHRGAPQLRSAAVHLRWYQLWLLDVAAALAAVAILLAVIIWAVARAFLGCIRPKPTETKDKVKSS